MRKHLTSLLVVAAVFILLGVTTFTMVDVSGDAEPSWAETKLASMMLHTKLRFNGSKRVSPLTATEEDLVRGSDLYERQCGHCHGVTRGRMAPLAKAFSPRPPQFVILPAQGPTWMDAYVIQHGIRWTGMPAFRGLSESDAWRLALYVEGRAQPKEE